VGETVREIVVYQLIRDQVNNDMKCV
jgi:hypothetical protein